MLSAQPSNNSEQPNERARQHLTVAEVADLLRVSRWTVGRYIAVGDLKATKASGSNGAVRIPLASYDEFLQRHTVEPNTEEAQ